MRLGADWSLFITCLVLRHAGRDFALSGLDPSVRPTGSFECQGAIATPRDAFAALTHPNPTGGTKHCLNTKVAACELRVTRKQGSAPAQTEVLSAAHRAAFEILTDDRDHGVELRV